MAESGFGNAAGFATEHVVNVVEGCSCETGSYGLNAANGQRIHKRGKGAASFFRGSNAAPGGSG